MPGTNRMNTEDRFTFDSIEECIGSFAAGNFLILVDSPARENEADLILPAHPSVCTPHKISFLIHHTSGYICAPLAAAHAARLSLPFMVPESQNTDPNGTRYAVSVDAKGRDVTTGISAKDRCATLNALAEHGTEHVDLRRPGHVLPLIGRPGGLRERQGHTEGCLELLRLAGWGERGPLVGVIAELVAGMSEARSASPTAKSARDVNAWHGKTAMMDAEEALQFGRRWGIKCCTVDSLREHVQSSAISLGAKL